MGQHWCCCLRASIASEQWNNADRDAAGRFIASPARTGHGAHPKPFAIGKHLPGLKVLDTALLPDEVFAALHVQRLRLRHDQQVPE